MSGLKFESIAMKEDFYQLKLIADFPGGGKALYKPMRFTREKSVI
jgi:hypothetical protein